MVRIIVCFLLTICIGCNRRNNEVALSDSQLTNKIKEISPLAEGEFKLDNSVFGKTIDLTGTCHPVDNIFEVRELEMMATDSLLIVKNKNGENMFMVYSLPNFSLLHSFGRIGNGPDEFQFPVMIRTQNPGVYCYIKDLRKTKLLALNHTLDIRQLSVQIPISSLEGQICSVNDSNFFMVSFNEGEESIIELKYFPDTLISNFYYNLAFSNNSNNWTSYLGDFGLNYDLKRMVYAYKYFKRIVFIDIVNKKSRVISFDEQNTETELKNNPLGPENTTYYWEISSNSKYVYLLYSGRTPIDVTEELRSGPGYIYVEQFDWNGNPIQRFKLDRWGYFCVSEDEKTIYLASITEEQPFYSYSIPDLTSQP